MRKGRGEGEAVGGGATVGVEEAGLVIPQAESSSDRRRMVEKYALVLFIFVRQDQSVRYFPFRLSGFCFCQFDFEENPGGEEGCPEGSETVADVAQDVAENRVIGGEGGEGDVETEVEEK